MVHFLFLSLTPLISLLVPSRAAAWKTCSSSYWFFFHYFLYRRICLECLSGFIKFYLILYAVLQAVRSRWLLLLVTFSWKGRVGYEFSKNNKQFLHSTPIIPTTQKNPHNQFIFLYPHVHKSISATQLLWPVATSQHSCNLKTAISVDLWSRLHESLSCEQFKWRVFWNNYSETVLHSTRTWKKM